MSPVAVSFSAKDLLRGKVVEPAWYRCKINSVGESAAKQSDKGPSTNYPVEVSIIRNADNGDTTYKDVPIEFNFNSKAMGFAIGYLNALGVEVKADTPIDLQASEGMEIEIFIENDTYNQRVINKVNHKYRKAA